MNGFLNICNRTVDIFDHGLVSDNFRTSNKVGELGSCGGVNSGTNSLSKEGGNPEVSEGDAFPHEEGSGGNVRLKSVQGAHFLVNEGDVSLLSR